MCYAVRRGNNVSDERQNPSESYRGTSDRDPWRSPTLVLSEKRKQELLGRNPAAPVSDAAVQHTMHFVSRVLKSWSRKMASGPSSHLPPIVHHTQFSGGVPTALSNCVILCKMWTDYDVGTRELVQSTTLQEVRRLLREVRDDQLALL